MKIFFTTFLIFLTCLTSYAQVWEYAGLANKAQRDAGYIGGEGGQWLQGLAIDHADGMVLLHGSDVGGLWRSTNGGKTWEPANSGYTPRGTCGLFIDPNNPARAISVGSNSNKAFFNNYHGLYMTTDTAKTWKQVMPDNNCGYRDIREQISYDPSSYDAVKGYSTIIYYSRIAWTAGSEGGSGSLAAGLYKSTDGGSSWKLIANTGTYSGSILKVNPVNGCLYVANAAGFFRSKNQGVSFEKTFSGNVKGMDVFPGDASKVYLCTTNKIYISSDSGTSFIQKPATGFPAYANYLGVSPVDSMHMMTQLLNPSDPWNSYYMYSKNGGASWAKTSNNNSLDFLPRNFGRLMYPAWSPVNKDVAFAVGGDFITKTSDGGVSLANSNDGASAIMSAGVLGFNLDNPSLVFFSAQDYDAAVSVDSGYSYKYLNMSGLGYGGNIHGGYIVDSLTWFGRNAAGWEDLPADLKITFNGGVSYQVKGKSGGLSSCFGAYGDRNVLFAGDLRSDDKGNSWTKMSGCDGVLTSDPSGNHDLYGLVNSNTIVRSADKGVSWKAMATLPSGINDIAFDYVNQAMYASCYTAGLWKVYFSDSAVIDISENTPPDIYGVRRFSTVAVDPVNPEIVYAGGTRDIYSNDVSVIRSVDGGDTWIPLTVAPRHNNSQFGMAAGYETGMIRVNPVTRYAWCGTSCFGIWKIGPPAVVPGPKPKIRLNQSLLVMGEGSTFRFKATISNTTDTLVTWSSSNPSSLSIDSLGLVTALAPGTSNVTAKTTLGGMEATCQVFVSEPKGPYGGSPHVIPGKIEAENFDIGGEGFGYHDASLQNEGNSYRTGEGVDIEVCGEGGYDVGWTAGGEWLAYTVVVDSTMDYNIDIRAAANSASKVSLDFSNGNKSTGDISLPATGGWQSYKTFSRKAVALEKGLQEMRVNIVLAGFNLNYITISRTPPVGVMDEISEPGLKIFPNPLHAADLHIVPCSSLSQGSAFIEIISAQGKRVFAQKVKTNDKLLVEKSFLGEGIYLVRYSTQGRVITDKLIVW